jgi:hypothetical protein
VLAATVRLANLDGQGVLVPGGSILAAGHCVEWSGAGEMALGGYFVERVRTHDGRTFLTRVAAAEPVADIAALGPPNDQETPADCDAFAAFTGAVQGVPLYARAVEPGASVPVRVLEAVEAQLRRAVAANDLERQIRLQDQAARLEADLIAWEIDLTGW